MSSKKKVKKRNLKLKNISSEKVTNNSATNEDDGSVDLSDILKKRWKVFRCSPLYNYSGNKLKLYAKKLSQELTHLKYKLSSVVSYESTFTLNEKLKLNNEGIDALQVKVVANQSRKVYLGYFIAWKNKKQETQNSTYLPILLVEGQHHEVHEVHLLLCKMFDCDIQPVKFSFNAMVTFFARLLETKKKNTSEEFLVLEYKIPGCEVTDCIQVTLSLQDTCTVLTVITDSLCERFKRISSLEVILDFYNRILNHIYNCQKLDLMLGELCRIVFPNAYIADDGQIRVSSNEDAINVLFILQKFIPLEAVTNV